MPTKKCPYCAEEIQEDAVKCKHCGSWLENPPDPALAAPPQYAGPGPVQRPLLRSTGNRMIAGVCGGLGAYFGIDPTWLRVIYALVTFFTGIIPGLVVYLILTIVVPLDTRPY
jgi:phage shock protein PspC (stress-responsive transcriptional regulator)